MAQSCAPIRAFCRELVHRVVSCDPAERADCVLIQPTRYVSQRCEGDYVVETETFGCCLSLSLITGTEAE